MNSTVIDFVLLIPCHNNISGLAASIRSISYPPDKYEVLIVDDGSDIPITKNELKPSDPKVTITIIRLEHNQGIAQALNAGLASLKSRTDVEYIARLDAGDTCHQERFRKQVDFLNRHKEIALLASWARFQNETLMKGYDYITKSKHEEIVKEMHYKCSFIHPSVMFRKEVLDTVALYPLSYPHAEDYAFFWKILKKNKGAVIPEKLVNIVFSDKNISSENYKKQLRSRKKIVKEFGNLWLPKMAGLAILTIKQIMPKNWINVLKSF
jgi:glycosyltransferase involved in cell wall biosynthesis